MSLVALSALIVQQTKAVIYDTALAVARGVGLPVDTWEPGDPTRSVYHLVAEILSTRDSRIVAFIKAGFLEYATGDWLKILAKQVYDVDYNPATYATTDVTLTNGGGFVGDFDPGDLVFVNTSSGKTYTNTTGGHLAASGTLTVTVAADEPGAASSAGVGEIDDLQTTILGVTVSNASAAVGQDEETEDSIKQRCRDKLGSLSPNGPAAAYAYVARTSTLTGTSNITRVRIYPESDTGDVLMYLAGSSGEVTSDDRDAVDAAIAKWATPLCITPTVASASNVTVDVTYELWVYESVGVSEDDIKAAIESSLGKMFGARPIGGDIIPPATTGKFYKAMVESTIRTVYPNHTFNVVVPDPSGDTDLENDEVAAIGAIDATIHFIPDPS